MAGRIEGKVAVVTGAGSGIGRAIAKRFVAEGASLIANDIVAEGLDSLAKELAKELGDSGGRVVMFPGDMSQSATASAMADRAVKQFGRIDVWVNTAGGSYPIAFTDIDEKAYRAEFAKNLDTAWFGCQAAIRVMEKQRAGSIINFASGAAILASQGLHAYSAAKAAILSLTRNLALEYGPIGIRVNAIAPGAIRTPVFEAYLASLPDKGKSQGDHIPMKRLGRPEELAAAVLFLASDDASYVTGVTLPVDGAITAVLTPPKGL